MQWKRRVSGLAIALLVGTVGLAACDGDDNGEHTIRAGEPSYSDSGEEVISPEEQGSPGPVQGQERPPGHPTLEDVQDGEVEMAAPSVDQPSPEEFGQQGPIRWDAPEGWEATTPSNEMRFAEYRMVGDGGEAEVSVFFFGPGGGGGVEQNLERWSAQFSDGEQAQRREREVDGMTVHTVDVSGTYENDMAMGGGGGPQEQQRLLGAIAEASAGLFFFRLLGDAEVVREQEEAFEQFVESMRDEG